MLRPGRPTAWTGSIQLWVAPCCASSQIPKAPSRGGSPPHWATSNPACTSPQRSRMHPCSCVSELAVYSVRPNHLASDWIPVMLHSRAEWEHGVHHACRKCSRIPFRWNPLRRRGFLGSGLTKFNEEALEAQGRKPLSFLRGRLPSPKFVLDFLGLQGSSPTI